MSAFFENVTNISSIESLKKLRVLERSIDIKEFNGSLNGQLSNDLNVG